MHGNDKNMLFWSQFKFRITFQLQLLEWNIFSYYFKQLRTVCEIDTKTKKNKINYLNFVLYYQIIRIAYFCVKTEKSTILLHFMEVLYQKDWKNMPLFLWLPWQLGCRNNIDYDIKLFAIRF